MEDRSASDKFELLSRRRKANAIRENYVAAVLNSRRQDFERKVREAQHVREQIQVSEKAKRNMNKYTDSQLKFKSFERVYSKYRPGKERPEEHERGNSAYRRIKTEELQYEDSLSMQCMGKLKVLEDKKRELSRKMKIFDSVAST